MEVRAKFGQIRKNRSWVDDLGYGSKEKVYMPA